MLATEGIVIKSTKYGESSLILDVFTREEGLLHLLLNSVRKFKGSAGAGVVQAMSYADWVIYDRANAGLQRVKEVRPAHIYHHLPYEVPRMAVGLCVIEMLQQCLREPEPNAELYDFVKQIMLDLDNAALPYQCSHLYFCLQLTRFLGCGPEGEFQAETPWFDLKEGAFVANKPDHTYFLAPTQAEHWSKMLATPAHLAHLICTNREERNALLLKILQYFQLHIPYFKGLQSLSVLQQMLY